MKKLLVLLLLAVSAAAAWRWKHSRRAGPGFGPADVSSEEPGARAYADPAVREFQAAVADWPPAARATAQAMLAEYGLPDETTRGGVAWNDSGPWKWVLVRRDGGALALEQTAAYRVPNDRYELLRGLPGGVSAERGRETLSARAGSETLDILALNLADEVLSGKRPAAEARAFYEREAALAAAGKASPYAQRLFFVEPATARK